MTGSREYANQQFIYAQYQAKAQYDAIMQDELNKIYSKDTWRKIGDSTNLARGVGWVEFQGKAQETISGGVVFKGQYGQVLTVWLDSNYCANLMKQLQIAQAEKNGVMGKLDWSQFRNTTPNYSNLRWNENIFFVEGFPYESTPNTLYEKLMAFDAGYYSYTGKSGQQVTVHKLIYGTPCTKIWTPEEIAAIKEKAKSNKDAAKQAMVAKVLKSNQSDADRGDAYGLMRMGERYRDGEDVQKDLVKAKAYLAKAAAAGETTAADELSKLQIVSQN